VKENSLQVPGRWWERRTGQSGAGLRCLGLSRPRGRDPTQSAGLGADDLHIEPGGLVPTGVDLGVIGPGPALQEVAVDGQLAGGIEVLHGRHAAF